MGKEFAAFLSGMGFGMILGISVVPDTPWSFYAAMAVALLLITWSYLLEKREQRRKA